MTLKELSTGLAHVGIPTNDLDETILFYNELGFEIVHLNTNPENGARVAFLKLGDLMLETYEGEDPTGLRGAVEHIAIAVEDIEAAYETVCNHALNNTDDFIHFLPYWESGVRFFTIQGPNKEKVEFCQRL